MKSLAAAAGHSLTLQVGDAQLDGVHSFPKAAREIVVFCDGKSSRFSRQCQLIARNLNQAGIATLLVDLLTTAEETIDCRTRHLRFNIPLLTERLSGVLEWMRRQDDLAKLPVGLFGSNTAAAAAFSVAAQRPKEVGAAISHNGRPDLAGEFLARVKVPVLLIVDHDDRQAIDRNHKARRLLPGTPGFEIFPSPSRAMGRPGEQPEVAGLVRRWFQRQLAARHGTR